MSFGPAISTESAGKVLSGTNGRFCPLQLVTKPLVFVQVSKSTSYGRPRKANKVSSIKIGETIDNLANH